MRIRVAAIFVFCLSVALAAPAAAQYGARRTADRPTGENYHVELAGDFWSPTPDILITSKAAFGGQLATPISFVDDLGIEKSRFRQLKVVLRPAEKHKFRFEYTPIRYAARSTLHRTVVFNGISFPLSLPVDSELKWNAYRFGYEYDFVYTDRGFFGVVLEAKYTDVEASLTNVFDTEFVHARAPIPALGAIGRVYAASNISITGEFGAFKLPGSIREGYGGRYFDFDLYGTVNFNEHVGGQVGYRSFDVFYKVDEDEGDFTLKGLYFGGVVRF